MTRAGTRRRSAKGIALITVLLITAVITIIVAAMTTQQSVDIRRTANILDRNQAYTIARGGELFVDELIKADTTKDVDTLSELSLANYAINAVYESLDEGNLSGELSDQNACFNINDLAVNGTNSPVDIQRFKRLLSALNLDPNLADAAADWIDADNTPSYPGGAESDYYARLDPPYAIANRALMSVSELSAVKGFSPEVMTKLRENHDVCALPKRSKININTASAEVLMTLAPGMTPAIAKAIIEQRSQSNLSDQDKSGHFANLNELYAVSGFNALLTSAMKTQLASNYGVTSSFFLARVEGSFAEGDVILYSLLERDGKTIKTYYRAQGSY